MVTIKNTSASQLIVNYNKLDSNSLESFDTGKSYDLQECQSIRHPKGLAILIKEVLSGNMECKVDGILVNSDEASEFCIQANVRYNQRNTLSEKLKQKACLLEGFAQGFLYINDLQVIN